MLRWRLLLGAVFIAAVAGLVWLDAQPAAVPGAWLMPVVVVLVILATSELLQLCARAGLKPRAWSIYTGNLMVIAAAWVPLAVGNSRRLDQAALALAALCLAAFALFLDEIRRFEKPGGITGRVAAGMLALVYVGGLFGVLVHLRMIFGLLALVTLIVVVKMGDTGAYTIGRLIGRHKLAPALSPGKTVEGAFGHLAFACFGAWLCLVCLAPAFDAQPVVWWQWLVFGLVVGAAGMVGDLAESLIKRDVGAKDSSTWMPGFGGVLDVLDSILLAAPVAWIAWFVLVR